MFILTRNASRWDSDVCMAHCKYIKNIWFVNTEYLVCGQWCKSFYFLFYIFFFGQYPTMFCLCEKKKKSLTKSNAEVTVTFQRSNFWEFLPSSFLVVYTAEPFHTTEMYSDLFRSWWWYAGFFICTIFIKILRLETFATWVANTYICQAYNWCAAQKFVSKILCQFKQTSKHPFEHF